MAETTETETSGMGGSDFYSMFEDARRYRNPEVKIYLKNSAEYAELYTYVQAVRLAAEDLGMTVSEPFNPSASDITLIHNKMLSDKAKYGLPDKCDKTALTTWHTYSYTYSGKKGVATVGQVSYAHDAYLAKENDALQEAKKEKSDTEKEIAALTYGKDGKPGTRALTGKIWGQRFLRAVPIALGFGFAGVITAGITAVASGVIAGLAATSLAGVALTAGTLFGGIFGVKKLAGWVKKINDKIAGFKKQRQEMREKRSEAKAKLAYMTSKEGKYTKAVTKQAENAEVEFKRITRTGTEVVSGDELARESMDAYDASRDSSMVATSGDTTRTSTSGDTTRTTTSADTRSAESAYMSAIFPGMTEEAVTTRLKTWLPGYVAGKTPEYPVYVTEHKDELGLPEASDEVVEAFLSRPELVDDEYLPDLIYASTKTAEELGMKPEDKEKLDRLAYRVVETLRTPEKVESARKKPKLSAAVEYYIGSSTGDKFLEEDEKAGKAVINEVADKIIASAVGDSSATKIIEVLETMASSVKSLTISGLDSQVKIIVFSAIEGENKNKKLHAYLYGLDKIVAAAKASGDSDLIAKYEPIAKVMERYRETDEYKELADAEKTKKEAAEKEKEEKKAIKKDEEEAKINSALKSISSGKFEVYSTEVDSKGKKILIEDNIDILLTVMPIVMDSSKAKEYGYKTKGGVGKLKKNAIAALGLYVTHAAKPDATFESDDERTKARMMGTKIKGMFDSLPPDAQKEVLEILAEQDKSGSSNRAELLQSIVESIDESDVAVESAIEADSGTKDETTVEATDASGGETTTEEAEKVELKIPVIHIDEPESAPIEDETDSSTSVDSAGGEELASSDEDERIRTAGDKDATETETTAKEDDVSEKPKKKGFMPIYGLDKTKTAEEAEKDELKVPVVHIDEPVPAPIEDEIEYPDEFEEIDEGIGDPPELDFPDDFTEPEEIEFAPEIDYPDFTESEEIEFAPAPAPAVVDDIEEAAVVEEEPVPVPEEAAPVEEVAPVEEKTPPKPLTATTDRGLEVIDNLRSMGGLKAYFGNGKAMEYLSDVLPMIMDDDKVRELGIDPENEEFEELREFACVKLSEVADFHGSATKEQIEQLERTWLGLENGEKQEIFDRLELVDERNKKKYMTEPKVYAEPLMAWARDIEAAAAERAAAEEEKTEEEKAADEIVERVGEDSEAFGTEAARIAAEIKEKMKNGEIKSSIDILQHEAPIQIALDELRERMTTVERDADGKILSVTTSPELDKMDEYFRNMKADIEEARLAALEDADLDEVFISDKTKLAERKAKSVEEEVTTAEEDKVPLKPYEEPDIVILDDDEIKFIPKACADISDKVGGMDKIAEETAGVVYTTKDSGELEEKPKLGYYLACCVAYDETKGLKGKKKEQAYNATMARLGYGKEGHQVRREPYYTRGKDGRMKRTEFGAFLATFRSVVGKEKVGAYASAVLDVLETSGMTEQEVIARILAKGKEQQKKENRELKKPTDEDAAESGG